jgi:hypothetical protein
MKIKTWIKYEESYIPPRCRKPRYNECEEYVNINLSETTMSALQLAFEDNSYDGVGKIFFYKGKLWTKSSIRDICAGGEDEYGYHTSLEALVWWREHGSRYFRFGFDREHYGRDTSREAVLKQARKDMRRYLLVDGELYHCTSEPRYCIYTFGLGHNHGGTALSVDYRYNPNISKNRYFSALQGVEAVAEANQIAQRRGDTNNVGRFDAEIKVFMPELVKVNSQKQHGNGSLLLNTFDEITSSVTDSSIASLLCMVAATHEM